MFNTGQASECDILYSFVCITAPFNSNIWVQITLVWSLIFVLNLLGSCCLKRNYFVWHNTNPTGCSTVWVIAFTVGALGVISGSPAFDTHAVLHMFPSAN